VLNCGHEAAVTDGMWAASNLLNKDKDGVIGNKMLTAEPSILQIAVNEMNGKTKKRCEYALTMMANFFRIEDGNVCEKAIAYGYFNKVEAVLYKASVYSTELIKQCLWGLSNMVAETPQMAMKFFDEKMLVKRVCFLGSSDQFVIRGETNWVLSNAITMIAKEGSGSFDNLKKVWDIYHEFLVENLNKNLEDFLERGN